MGFTFIRSKRICVRMRYVRLNHDIVGMPRPLLIPQLVESDVESFGLQ